MRRSNHYSISSSTSSQRKGPRPATCIPAIGLTLLLAGCSADYNGERSFWKAHHLQDSIAKDVKLASPEQISKIIAAYTLVPNKAPGTVWAARAQGMVGSLYAVQKQYEKSRNALAILLREYNQYQDLVLTARLTIAKTYESENRWDDAVKMYQEISDYHPWSTIGMEAPLYVASKYEEQHKPELARSAYDKAQRFYTTHIPDAPTAELGIRAKGYLAQTLERLGRWDQAAKTLEEILQEPKNSNRPLVLLALGSIYQTKMGRPEKAVEMYSQLVRDFPKHPYVKFANAQLEHLHAVVTPNTSPTITPTTTTPTTP